MTAARTAAFLERIVETRARRVQRRHDAEEQAREHRQAERERQEIERELAEAVEHGAEADAERLMLTLKEVQLEVARLENQEALVDGFGVMSGRVKGPAGGGH